MINLPKFNLVDDELRLKYEFALFSIANDKTELIRYISPLDYVNMIKSDEYKNICESIRSGEPKKELKRNLPLVHFLGEVKYVRANRMTVELGLYNLNSGFKRSHEFIGRDIWSLYNYNGVVVLDIDDIEDINEFELKLKDIDWVWIAHKSPSGIGYRIIVRTPNLSINEYTPIEVQISNDLFEKTGYKSDKNVNNINTSFFSSYDPNIYHNSEASLFIPKFENPF